MIRHRILTTQRIQIFLLFCSAFLAAHIQAGEEETRKSLLGLTSENFKEKKAAVEKLAQSGDPRLIQVFDDFSKGNLYLWKEQLVSAPETLDVKGTKSAKLLDPLTRKAIQDGSQDAIVSIKDLKEVEASAKDRVMVRDAVKLLKFFDPDAEKRLSAVRDVGDSGNESNLPTLISLLEREKDEKVKRMIHESVLLIQLGVNKPGPEGRIESAKQLGQLAVARALPKLKTLLTTEKDPETVRAFTEAMKKIESWQSTAESIKTVFSGLSLGSILVLMALGLSIIFGLMGVINMAHGELMMIGAYATYLTQEAFVRWLPESSFNYYFIVAIPVSFAVAALVGYLIEVLVIRHLYGRPLETLLATFGISLVLIQAVRLQFGDNIAVNSPTWLQGGAEVIQDVVLPYNRCFIIGFCGLCIMMMYFIMGRTKLGLLLRATTQNRGMAASLGVHTRRIDGYTFALGAGLAGMAGCALTQIGGVTPDMGQNYIVDSFLVVVTGGVGKLAGAIWAGLGLGCLNKLLEPSFQAVWAKVLILIFVVLFLQWRPSGLFPAKGRLADV
jgi:urea transport system permease protein